MCDWVIITNYYFTQSCNNNFPGNESEIKAQPSINITCSDQFYLDESSQICKPECGVWTQHSDVRANLINGIFIAGDILGVLVSTTVLVLSCVQRKQM